MSDSAWLLLVRFGVACVGSVLLAALLGALLQRLARSWPALRAHRSVWLSAQLALVLGMLLAVSPMPRSAVAPTVTLPATDDAALALGAGQGTVIIDLADASPAAGALDAALYWLPPAWLGVYLAGFAWHAGQRLRTAWRWHRLLRRHARTIDPATLSTFAAITPEQRICIARGGLAVTTIDLPLSPMLHGVLRPRLLLPTQLATLDAAQQQLVVEHELMHWRRADPFWLALSGWLALLCWFNRPQCRFDGALREAVELGCDDAVLAGRAGAERQAYAAALVAQWRLQLACQVQGAAFGSVGVAGRVQRMRRRQAARLGVPVRIVAGAGLLGVTLLGAALQPAFSHAPAMPTTTIATMPPAVAEHVHATWRWPLAAPRVTSLYGVRSPSRPRGHHGIDLAARRGTPVHAVAAGRVAVAAFDPAWGHHVLVDHGGGRSSLLMHLDRIDVAPGQQVAAGDPLGTSGASGKATGPHLHLEYWQDGQRLDPALVLPDLDQRSTARALAQHADQGHPVPTDL